jgi:hypothetical protein
LARKALAGVVRDEKKRAQHIAAARKAWLSIKRDDLVRRWLDETEPSEGSRGGADGRFAKVMPGPDPGSQKLHCRSSLVQPGNDSAAAAGSSLGMTSEG